MTTEIRGGECEVTFPKPPWLRQESVVNVLGIAGVDHARVVQRIAPFPKDSFPKEAGIGVHGQTDDPQQHQEAEQKRSGLHQRVSMGFH